MQLVVFFTLLGATAIHADSTVDGLTCKKFKDIYDNGAHMCQKMFSDSFVVDNTGKSDNISYTMAFYDAVNPNIALASTKYNKHLKTKKDGSMQCGLQYYHLNYSTPQKKAGQWKECQYYQQQSCCKNTTLTSFTTMNENYGEKYHVDRCGPMSDSCKSFFMMEACFYECDPAAGLYRKFTDAQVAADVKANGSQTVTNTWQMYKMPIKKSLCDAWYSACYNDNFCADNGGDFFSCAKIYKVPVHHDDELPRVKRWNDDLTIITVLVTFFGLLLLIGIVYLIYRERTGKAVFAPLMKAEGEGGRMEMSRMDTI